MPGFTQQAESYTTPTPIGKARQGWCPDQYPDINSHSPSSSSSSWLKKKSFAFTNDLLGNDQTL
jgi:hypothetical protein